MSGQEILITYNHTLAPLEEVIGQIKRPGDYYTAGSHQTPMPLLNVAGAGTISFPVPEDQARGLIGHAAERAPYGRGDQTLIDESVRKVWQIGPEKVTLRGKGWERSFQELLGKVASGLGCEADRITAEFYKLLVYDEGAHFAPHRDTEKAPGMFGTLVVALPSAHQGGDLIVRHGGGETVLRLEGDDPGEVSYAAFYADCEHEVRPVTQGYRVCLVYNLVATPETQPPAAPDNLPAVETATRILRKWAETWDEPVKLVYLLEHQYTQATLAFGGLKGSDAARAWVLREACQRTQCAVHLGIVHIEESGWAEYRQDDWYSRGDYDDDEDEDQSEFEIGEVDDGEYYIDQWRDVHDQPVDFGRIPIADAEILPAGALDDEEPDHCHFSEATGNEGASFERAYLRAALIIWPVARFDAVCISGGLDAAIARLGQLVDAAEPAATGKGRLSRFLALMPTDWPSHQDHRPRFTALFGHLARRGDPKLLLEAGSRLPLRAHYSSAQNETLLQCAKILGARNSLKFFTTLFEGAAAREPAACLDLWRNLADTCFPQAATTLDAILDAWMRQAPQAKPAVSKPATWYPWHASPPKQPEDKPLELSLGLLADFLAAALNSVGPGRCRQFLDALSTNPDCFPVGDLLLPCLEQVTAENGALVPSVTAHLWANCAAFLLERSSVPPEAPKDWAQEATFPEASNEPLLRDLQRFVRDPLAREHRFRVRKELRQRLHQAIDRAKLDMTHITERTGTPHVLVCTKTRATYDRARRTYENDVDAMRRLLANPMANLPETATAAERLRGAVAQCS